MEHLKIAITLPYLFSVRDFLFTPLWDEMKKNKDITFYIISSDDWSKKVISSRKCSNIVFVKYPPEQSSRPNIIEKAKNKILPSIQKIVGNYVDNALLYRYASVNNLSHYVMRKNKTPEEQKRNQVFSNYLLGEKAGIPFPRSRVMFRLFYELRYLINGIVFKRDEKLFKSLDLDILVLGRTHMGMTAYWSTIAKKLGVPMIGIISSWDHPTTQGPTPRGMSGYVVASKKMVEEMSELHGIDRKKIQQVGKVQMDIINNPSVFMSKTDFLKKLGVPANNKLITFGTNCFVLKDHEVSIARYLANAFKGKQFGDATLVLRTHPQDKTWKEDFLSLASPPWVTCHNASSFSGDEHNGKSTDIDDQAMLVNLMKHSDLVIQSRGSMALDAIAQDRPVISLAFDGNLQKPECDSFIIENDCEHYKPLIVAKGMRFVGSYDALDRAIRGYLEDPTIHAEGRRIIREEQVEPLDGLASKRTIDYLVACARKSREGMLPKGDWDYNGLGDTTWSSRQICKTINYLDV